MVVQFVGRDTGVRWGIEWNKPQCPFCSDGLREGTVFEAPEDLLAHLRVYHSVFKYQVRPAR